MEISRSRAAVVEGAAQSKSQAATRTGIAFSSSRCWRRNASCKSRSQVTSPPSNLRWSKSKSLRKLNWYRIKSLSSRSLMKRLKFWMAARVRIRDREKRYYKSWSARPLWRVTDLSTWTPWNSSYLPSSKSRRQKSSDFAKRMNESYRCRASAKSS